MIASIILALYLYQFVGATDASTFLYVYGGLLIIAEFAVVSYGMIGFNGALALIIGYAIRTGDNTIFGLPIGWELWFGMAFVEFLLLAITLLLILRYQKIKTTTGKESMVGQMARIVSWQGKVGTVLIDGENWKAVSERELDLDKDDTVTVRAVDGLTLKIDT